MNKVLGTGIILLLVIFFSGCTEQVDQQSVVTPEYIVSDVYTSRGVERKIEYVYVEIQNFDDKDIIITVDFEFALLDLDQLGGGTYGGGSTGGGSDIWDDSYFMQKTVLIRAHDIEKIYFTPQSRYDNKIECEWDYTIIASYS
jgi:hypothetical protein